MMMMIIIIAMFCLFILLWTDRWPLKLQLTITKTVFLAFSKKLQELRVDTAVTGDVIVNISSVSPRKRIYRSL
jgi:hypothetical protein